MRSVYIGIITATAGALIGAAATYYVAGNNPPAAASSASVNQAQPRDPKMDISVVAPASANVAQDFTAARRDPPPLPATGTTPSASAPSGTVKKKPDPAEEEAMVQIVTSRLYDPAMTLPGIMQSEEMLKLSDEARERVVARMVEMLNRGEIDARAFMPAGK